jgi:hypothetical protein
MAHLEGDGGGIRQGHVLRLATFLGCQIPVCLQIHQPAAPHSCGLARAPAHFLTQRSFKHSKQLLSSCFLPLEAYTALHALTAFLSSESSDLPRLSSDTRRRQFPPG